MNTVSCHFPVRFYCKIHFIMHMLAEKHTMLSLSASKNQISYPHHQNFQYTLPTLLSPPLAALQYVMYFRFLVTSCLPTIGQAKATTIARIARSDKSEAKLLSTIVMFGLNAAR